MNDHPHSHQELEPISPERLEAHSDRALKEKAFRLTVARLWAYDGLDTKQIAEKMNVPESSVYNVLDAARKMIGP